MNENNKYTDTLQFVNESLDTIGVYLPGDLNTQYGSPGAYIKIMQVQDKIILNFHSRADIDLETLIKITHKMKEIESFYDEMKRTFGKFLAGTLT